MRCAHAHQVKKAKGALHISREGLEGLLPLQKIPSSALSLPCEIVSISQGRPLLAPEFTTSGQEEAGKGLKIPVCGGSSLHATPFRQEAAVHWMPMGHPHPASPAPQGRGPSRPLHSPESFCMTNHACTFGGKTTFLQQSYSYYTIVCTRLLLPLCWSFCVLTGLCGPNRASLRLCLWCIPARVKTQSTGMVLSLVLYTCLR
jgi:hypothetical protein